MLLLLLIVSLLRLLHSNVLLELIEQGRELSFEVIVDFAKLLDLLTEVVLLLHKSLRVDFQRVASRLQI